MKKTESIPQNLLYFIFLFPLIIRIFVFTQLQNTPIVNIPIADSKTYIDIATKILSVSWLGNFSTFTNPFYGYFVSIIKLVFGFLPLKNFDVVLLAQSILSSCTIVLIYKIAQRIFDKNIALISVILISLNEILVFFDNTILSVSLINFLNTAVIFTLYKYSDTKKYLYIILAGVLAGLSIITRANYIIFVIFIIIWFYILNQKTIVKTLKPLAIFAGGLIAVVLLMTIRNYIVSSEIITVSSNFGYNFYIGNNDKANGTYVIPRFITSTDQYYEEKQSENEANLRTGKQLSHSGASFFWFKEGLKFIIHHPGKYFQLEWKKIYLFFNNTEAANNLSNYTARDYSYVLKYLPSNFGIISAFGLLGIILSLIYKKSRKTLLIIFFLLSYFLANLIFMVASEYRAPLIPFMIMFGIYGIKQLWDYYSIKKYELIGVIIIPVIFFIYWTNYSNAELKTYRSTSADYSLYGHILQSSKNYTESSEMYIKAIASDTAAKEFNFDIANNYYAMNEGTYALNYYRITPGIDNIPDSMKLNYLQVQSDDDYKNRNFASACKSLRIIALYDTSYTSFSNLGACLIELDSLDAAISVLRKSISLKPDYYFPYINLGRIYDAKKMYDSAIINYETALKLNNSVTQVEFNLLQIYLKTGKKDKADGLRQTMTKEYSDKPDIISKLNSMFEENKK